MQMKADLSRLRLVFCTFDLCDVLNSVP